MDEARLNRLREELKVVHKKRDSLDAKVKDLERRLKEAENTYIHDIVHAANLTPEQLAELIRKAATGIPQVSFLEQTENDNATDEDIAEEDIEE